MRRSIKSYMLMDLAMITVIGCILEGTVTCMSGLVFSSVPTISISLLVVLLALVRWNFWGLITVPFLALSTIVGGMLSPVVNFKAAYEWRAYFSVVIGLLFTGFSVLVFKKKGTKLFNERFNLFCALFINILLRLISFHNLNCS